MANSAAHRGVLTREHSAHLCADGQFEEFCRRRLSRARANADTIIHRYRRRMQELAESTDTHQLTVKGLHQPTATGAYGMRVEDEP